MLNEYDVVALKRELPDKGLASGVLGTILVVHKEGSPAYEVEFCDSTGKTLALLTLTDRDLAFVKKG